MNWYHPHELARRATVAVWLVVASLGVTLIAFFRLQVVGVEEYATQSEQNRLRPITLRAPRGLITDRHGVVMAENIPSFTITVLASDRDSLAAVLERMAPLANLGPEEIEGARQRHRQSLDGQVVVLRDAPFEVVSALEERRGLFPGMVIQTEPKRRYPFGGIAAHVLGYVNEISERELEAGLVEGARRGAIVGRSGLERQYDDRLRGIDGRRFVEVDALGRTVREIGVAAGSEARPGDDLRSTLDAELQRYMSEVFPSAFRGAMVAMDPRNGDILAMYSSPSFDPNAVVGRVDPEMWREIRTATDNPMFNRAVQGRYPPASPWKLAVAAMAMRRGLVTDKTRMATPCRGGMAYYTRYFRCWKADGHGSLTLAEAIQHSCDVYFYQLGLQLELSNMLSDGADLGFREPTGIDLPGEMTPVYPASTAYFDERYGPRGWTRAVTLTLAIGQGENDQTLMNMVRFYAMLANENGVSPAPRLVFDAPEPSARQPSLALTPAQVLQLRQALVMVLDSGTAAGARISRLRIAGKTGTAQNPHGADHGWFLAFAPADDPEIVVGAIVEAGEHGSSVAPVVTRVIARHLLGDGEVPDRSIRLRVPADSAPEPVPLRRDSTRLGIGEDRADPRPR